MSAKVVYLGEGIFNIVRGLGFLKHNDEGARTNRGTINSKKRFLRGERQAFDALGNDGAI